MRRGGLKSTYYLWFLLLVVLPVMLTVLGGTMMMINRQMDEAYETIDTVHHSVSSALQNEVREASLSLAYFLLGNDQELLSLLDALPANQAQRYANTRQLQETFEHYSFQDKNIEAMHLYLKDGSYYGLTAQLAVPVAEAVQEDCCQKALQTPNQVMVGSVSPDLLHYATTHRGEVLLCAAMSVQEAHSENALSAACLYFSTTVEELIEDYNASMKAGHSFLTEGDRVLAGDAHAMDAAQKCLLTDGKDLAGYDGYTLTTIPHTDLAILTLVDNAQLRVSYYQTLGVILLAIAVILLLFVLFTRLFFRDIIRPIDELSNGMERLRTGDFTVRLKPDGHAELRTLGENFNETSARMEALISENQEQEKEKYQEEIKALQSEINPHFLLNTVNTIRFMAEMAHYDSIRNMAASLMEILRCVLRNPSERYTVADELRLLRSYAEIMDIRQPGAFTVEYDLAMESMACRIPKLLLQPLVENAIQHAFEDMEEPGVITVSSRVEGSELVLQVRDNGSGIPEDKLHAWKQQGAASALSIGMANVKRRLELNCGDGHGMEVESKKEEGTCITLRMPACYLSEGTVN